MPLTIPTTTAATMAVICRLTALAACLRANVPAPAVMPVSRGMADYLARERPGMVVIEHQGRVVYRGDGTDPGHIARALAGRDGRGW